MQNDFSHEQRWYDVYTHEGFKYYLITGADAEYILFMNRSNLIFTECGGHVNDLEGESFRLHIIIIKKLRKTITKICRELKITLKNEEG